MIARIRCEIYSDVLKKANWFLCITKWCCLLFGCLFVGLYSNHGILPAKNVLEKGMLSLLPLSLYVRIPVWSMLHYCHWRQPRWVCQGHIPQYFVWGDINGNIPPILLRTFGYTHTRLTAFCPGLPRWAGTRKVKPIWILLKQETVSGSGIRWAVCKSAPRSRQITTPAPHRSVFIGRMPFLPPNQQRQSTEGSYFWI